MNTKNYMDLVSCLISEKVEGRKFDLPTLIKNGVRKSLLYDEGIAGFTQNSNVIPLTFDREYKHNTDLKERDLLFQRNYSDSFLFGIQYVLSYKGISRNELLNDFKEIPEANLQMSPQGVLLYNDTENVYNDCSLKGINQNLRIGQIIDFNESIIRLVEGVKGYPFNDEEEFMKEYKKSEKRFNNFDNKVEKLTEMFLNYLIFD